MFIISLAISSFNKPIVQTRDAVVIEQHQTSAFIYDILLLVGSLGMIGALYGTGVIPGDVAFEAGSAACLIGVVDAALFYDKADSEESVKNEAEVQKEIVQEENRGVSEDHERDTDSEGETGEGPGEGRIKRNSSGNQVVAATNSQAGENAPLGGVFVPAIPVVDGRGAEYGNTATDASDGDEEEDVVLIRSNSSDNVVVTANEKEREGDAPDSENTASFTSTNNVIDEASDVEDNIEDGQPEVVIEQKAEEESTATSTENLTIDDEAPAANDQEEVVDGGEEIETDEESEDIEEDEEGIEASGASDGEGEGDGEDKEMAILMELGRDGEFVRNSPTLANFQTHIREAQDKGRMVIKQVYPGTKGNRLIFTPSGRIVLHFPNKIIGIGGSKIVTEAIDLLTSEELVFACWKGNEEEKQWQEREMDYSLRVGDMPGIVNTKDICIVDKRKNHEGKELDKPYHFHTLQPRFNQGTLDECVAKDPEASLQFISISLQLMQTLQKLLKKGLAYGDIKPENILVNKNKDGTFTIVLGDLAGLFGVNEFGEECTSYFLPPELWRFEPTLWGEEETPGGADYEEKDYAEHREIYSAGIALYFLIAKEYPPFIAKQMEINGDGNEAERAQFKHQDWVEGYEKWHASMASRNDPIALLIANMTARDPAKRPSIEEVIEELKCIDDSLPE